MDYVDLSHHYYTSTVCVSSKILKFFQFFKEMVIIANEFASRLREERKKHQWSKRFLAAAIEVNENTYHHYEDGDCFPSLPKLLALANCLNVSLDYLCGRSHIRHIFFLPPEADIHALLAENLKQLRRQTGFAQKEIAKELHIHQHTYQSYEIQTRFPTYQTFLKLANFYHVPLDRLIKIH